MKFELKKAARVLRQRGHSLNEIQKILRVSKSSISIWVRDVQLSPKQKKRLTKKGVSIEVIEKRRNTRFVNEEKRRSSVIQKGISEIHSLDVTDLKNIGAALYWAEGGKTQRSLVRFTNSDAQMMRLMMLFFRKVCHVPESKFRGYIHIHSHLNHTAAEKYWSHVTGIPTKQFFKTYRKKSIASVSKKDNLPFGTFDVYVCDTQLFLQIQGWIEGICAQLMQK